MGFVRHRRTGLRAAGMAGVAGVVAFVMVVPPTAHAESVTKADEATLADTASRVWTAAAADPGFAGTRLDTDGGEVTVYTVAAGASAAASGYRMLAGAGVPVRVAPAVLSLADAEQIKARLDSDWKGLHAQGIEVAYWGAGAQGGPFRIGVTGADKHRAELLRRYGWFGSHTVAVVESAMAVPLARQDDGPPYWGGAYIKPAGLADPVRDGCSSGFGAYSNGNGADYVLTAAHCTNPNDTRFWDGGDDYMARVTATDLAFDAAYIKVSSAPMIYDGAWNVGTAGAKRIARMMRPQTGGSFCTSGAYSGVRCGGVVESSTRDTTVVRNMFTGQPYTVQGYWTAQVSEQNLAGEGDSGGPAFALHPDGTRTALGMIVAGLPGAEVGCTGRPVARTCYSIVFISDITQITAARQLDVTR